MASNKRSGLSRHQGPPVFFLAYVPDKPSTIKWTDFTPLVCRSRSRNTLNLRHDLTCIAIFWAQHICKNKT